MPLLISKTEVERVASTGTKGTVTLHLDITLSEVKG